MGHSYPRIILFFILLFVGFNAHALTNSQPAYGDFSTFNVWMEIEGVAKGESYMGLCNGSLIAEDLIVTAAHCLSGSTRQENQITVKVGNYKTIAIKTTGRTLTQYYSDIDVVKSKRIYFLKSIDKKVREGRMTGTGSIGAYNDVALIELERPVDKSKLNVQFVNFVTPAEHTKILVNSKKYTFVAVTTNLISESTTNSKRYAKMKNVTFSSLINKAYALPMINPTKLNSTEEGDSGSPVLVNVSGQWKLFAVVKGVKRDFLSTKLEDWTKNPINITPEVNMYTPVGNKMCELLAQANRPCN